MATAPGTEPQPPLGFSPSEPRAHLAAAQRDLGALAFLALLIFALAWRFDLFARLVAGARWLDGKTDDALIVTIIALAFGFKVFAWRRWRESQGALAASVAATAAARRERDLSATVLETAGSLILVLDRRGRVVRFNPACETLTGYHLADLRDRPFWEVLLLPDEAARVRGVFADLCVGRYPNAHENHWVARDGRRRLIAWANTALLDGSGAVEYVVATGIDVTERRATEEALRASEVRLGLLTRQLPAFLWTTDVDLRLASFSGGGFRRGGIDPRGRVGKTLTEFFGTDNPAFPPLIAHRSALAGTPAEYPLHRDGRAYEIRVEPLRDAAGAIVGTLGLGVDVTEREQAAAALRDSEARFRAVFEGAAIGIGLTDLDRRPLMVNPALARLTGRDRAELAGRGFPYPTHPEDAARDAALYAELVAGARDHYQMEKRYVRADGTLAWGRLTTSLVRDAEGSPQYVIGMVEDITVRVEAEAALRAREARYRAVVEQAEEGIVLFEADSKRIVEANPAFLRLLGYTEAELAALTLYDLVAHDRASIDANTARVATTGYNQIGIREYRRKDGYLVPVEVSATALSASSSAIFCVVVRDITARRAAEAALRVSEARLQTVVESAPIILFTLDAAGMTTFAAGRGLGALGLTVDAVIGRPLLADDTGDPAVPGYVRRALAGETVEARVAVRDLVFAIQYAPLRDAGRAITGVIGVAANVTARTRAEAERDLARRLLVASREDERLRLARELHDGPVQDLVALSYHLIAPGQHHDPSLVAGQVWNVIGQLRGFVAELRPIGLEDFGLSAALEECVAQLVRDANADGPAVSLDVDPRCALLEPGIVLCLFRVSQEALRNAFRHAAARHVQLILRREAQTMTLSVADDGRGFDVPPRLAALAQRHHFGLIGLVERMEWAGGELKIASAPGIGTTIVATLPYSGGEGGNEDAS